MKKLALLLAGFGLFAATAVAQDDNTTFSGSSYGIDTKKFRFGAYLAPTMSWMRSTSKTNDDKTYNIANDGSKVGFIYGLMAEYYFQDNYAIVSGLQMNMGGGKMSMSRASNVPAKNTIQTASFDYNVSLLEIPVAIKLRTDPISNFRFFGQAGVTLGFRVARKAAYDLTYYNDNEQLITVSQDKDKIGSRGALNPGFAPINFQMNLGAGVEYPLTDKLAAYAGIFFNNGFLPDMTNPQNFELYDKGQAISVNNDFRDGNTRFNNFALRIGIFF